LTQEVLFTDMTVSLKSPFLAPCFAFAAASALSSLAHASLLIDDFNNTGGDGNPISLSASTGNIDDQFQTAPLTGSISDDRDVLLDQIFGINGIAIANQINSDTANGYISFSAAQFFSEADLEFSYVGLGGIDLTNGGANNAFELFVRSQSDFGLGEITWAVGIEDTLGNFDITPDSDVFEGFNRIDFSTILIDYTSVKDILLYVNAFSIASVESVQFDNFQAVPESGSFPAIAALGALVFALIRRRRRG
jgi:hypothetical protein